ncbi:D-inositol 3-phosphate glycosyltransferase [Frondihabitans sp. 762G35]|uniref:glycosyltransferase family 4 protein n=1 Tax=Frondihabitans sp. 762G35 TaxID=1446794 RepID=UPI000D210667|nr:glycosyltransferase family 1 protein [Frondihabitans sp. 762G35]ARC57424.1 D-inositol 3-phosphate glycosyltransferase [Frondihabitans sp. 762G35]
MTDARTTNTTDTEEATLAVVARLSTLLRAWRPGDDDSPRSAPRAEVVDAIVRELEATPSSARLWQVLAAATARIPSSADFLRFERRAVINGLRETLEEAVDSDAALEFPERSLVTVEGPAVIEVHDTSRTTKITGIQRVVRETVRRFHRDHDVLFVAWTDDATALRRLSDWETNSLLGLPGPVEGDDQEVATEILLPLSSPFVVSELVAETWRTVRLESIVAHAGLEVDVIGYDAVPMTSGETSHDGISGQYPLYLQSISRSTRIGAISSAAAAEFSGWRHMLGSTGLSGPDVRHVALAAEVEPSTPESRDEARRALGVDPSRPTVLVVGSHEPRKNHLAVVQAARSAWAQGHEFTLAFIGGASWSSDRFHEAIEALQAEKRPVTLVSRATDELLAAAYDVADFTLFPSLHEGFGLPVAESLALGTPVITSGYGSMKEIIDLGGGGLLVDPRDDRSITDALIRLLTDRALLARLGDEARARTVRTWDAYAADLWEYFHAPVAPRREAQREGA